MELYERLEQILAELRPAFRREATYGWFIVLMWGVLLCHPAPAVTSYLNALGLGERCYEQALHWFHSSAFSIDEVCQRWGAWLASHHCAHRLRGQLVYVGDGRKMPGVKGMHQESEDVSKPEWLRGHYFSALALLLSRGQAMFATPVALKLHDGLGAVAEKAEGTLVTQMAQLGVALMPKGSYAVLDAYYASRQVLVPFRKAGLHLISRGRSSTVAYSGFCPLPGKRPPGRPRKWGDSVKLKDLFAPIDACESAQVWLYGQLQTVYFQCFQFYWDEPQSFVLFVLTQLPNGKQIILLSSDPLLSGPEVIQAYGWRFKLELTFRTLLQLLGGFSYRFWLKAMSPTQRWPQPLELPEHSPEVFKQKVLAKVEAFERFVNLNAIALGLLQVLALEMSQSVWSHFPLWFRTLPSHGYPTEQVVRISLQHLQLPVLAHSRQGLLLHQLLDQKNQHRWQPPKPTDLVENLNP
jgi:hypothetical protein